MSTDETERHVDETERHVDDADRGTVVTDLNAGAGAVPILTALAAAPFLQAVATHFGNRLAGKIDAATKIAVRRLVTQILPIGSPRSTTARTPDPRQISLISDKGWEVTIHIDISPAALGQLLEIEAASLPEVSNSPTPRLYWHISEWRLAGADGQRMRFYRWDEESKSWNLVR
ncbi:hypothetical protein [Streptomyces sp. Agncl-13]|uniref:hypothetical protein n=1 Tax=Streptomyces sp. Agncl-13 TaxID=3400628 RepID=UPI003A84E98E